MYDLPDRLPNLGNLGNEEILKDMTATFFASSFFKSKREHL